MKLLTRFTAPACLALTFLATVTPRASAQGGDLSTTAARDQYQKATDAATRKDWAESRRIFLQLWKRSPTYDVASGLGFAEFKLGHHAIGAHYMALAVATMPIKEKLDERYRIEDALKVMEAAVGTVHVSVDIRGAEIRADGELEGTSPLTVDVFLEPGPHVIEAKLGEARASKSVEAVAGQSYAVDLVLPAAAAASIPLAISPMPVVGGGLDDRAKGSNRSDHTTEYVVVGAGAALTVIAGVIGTGYAIRASSKQSGVDDLRGKAFAQLGRNCTSGSSEAVCRDLSRAVGERNTANTVETAAFFAAGLLGAGTIATLIFWPDSKPSGRARIAPTFDQTGAALTVQGVF